jgi:hypothetical protein
MRGKVNACDFLAAAAAGALAAVGGGLYAHLLTYVEPANFSIMLAVSDAILPGRAVILAEHKPHVIAELCPSAALLDQGRKICPSPLQAETPSDTTLHELQNARQIPRGLQAGHAELTGGPAGASLYAGRLGPSSSELTSPSFLPERRGRRAPGKEGVPCRSPLVGRCPRLPISIG